MFSGVSSFTGWVQLTDGPITGKVDRPQAADKVNDVLCYLEDTLLGADGGAASDHLVAGHCVERRSRQQHRDGVVGELQRFCDPPHQLRARPLQRGSDARNPGGRVSSGPSDIRTTLMSWSIWALHASNRRPRSATVANFQSGRLPSDSYVRTEHKVDNASSSSMVSSQSRMKLRYEGGSVLDALGRPTFHSCTEIELE